MTDDAISERDGPTLEEMDRAKPTVEQLTRDLAEWRARGYGHVGHPVAVPTCPLCIALSDTPEVKA